MQIFLTSQASAVMGKITTMLPKPANEYKLAFVPTAGDPYGDNKPWMDADRAMLVDLGFQVEDFDLKNKTEFQTKEVLSKFDVIFVAGGNTFHLLNEVKKSGFDKVATQMVKDGAIYIGSSAGSYIACPHIEAASWKHADRNQVGLSDLTALNLVNFIVSCHYTDDLAPVIAAGRKTTDLEVITLRDDQFIAFDGEQFQIYP